MRKGLKIFLIVSISVTISIAILIAAIIFAFSNIEIKTSSDKPKPSVEQITDEDILDFLESVDIINENDIYVDYDRDIGLFGPEGNKSYIYRRENVSYYYVWIDQLTYYSYDATEDYVYKPNTTFYVVIIQDCSYNIFAESMDERIVDEFGDKYKYTVSVSRENNDFEFSIVEQSVKSP